MNQTTLYDVRGIAMNKTETRHYKELYNEMILRDFLALDRTILANKRTFLAYTRTFIGLVAGGIGMIELVANGIINIIGYVFIFVAIPVILIGLVDYMKMRKALFEIEKRNTNLHIE